MKIKIIFLFLLLIAISGMAFAETKEVYPVPVYYPEGIIGSASPYIIWYDKYTEKDKTGNIRYRITINSKQSNFKPLIIAPEIYDENYYYYKIPFLLEQEKYEYLIERLADSKPLNSKYFSYRKYPISGEFIIDYGKRSKIDKLPPQMLIEYIKLEEKNRLENGYNSLFFGTAAIGSFGIGFLFYKIFDFGMISKIIYTIAFTSGAVGIGASGYYGYKYLKGKNDLQKILNISKDVSFDGNFLSTNITAGCKLSF